jgi:hypothetical protein
LEGYAVSDSDSVESLKLAKAELTAAWRKRILERLRGIQEECQSAVADQDVENATYDYQRACLNVRLATLRLNQAGVNPGKQRSNT